MPSTQKLVYSGFTDISVYGKMNIVQTRDTHLLQVLMESLVVKDNNRTS